MNWKHQLKILVLLVIAGIACYSAFNSYEQGKKPFPGEEPAVYGPAGVPYEPVGDRLKVGLALYNSTRLSIGKVVRIADHKFPNGATLPAFLIRDHTAQEAWIPLESGKRGFLIPILK